VSRLKLSQIMCVLVACVIYLGTALSAQAQEAAASGGAVAQLKTTTKQLQDIPVAGRFNMLQLLVLVGLIVVIWFVYGEKIKAWLKEKGGVSGIFSGMSGVGGHGVETVYRTLRAHGWTPEEAEEAVQENWPKIRRSLEADEETETVVVTKVAKKKTASE
jgi:hypothetical protein